MTNSFLHTPENLENSEDVYDVEDSFPMLMATCVQYMRKTLNARVTAAGHKVTSEQWMILTCLAQQEGVSQQDLADRYDRTKVSTLALLKKLEKNGLITREPDPVDGRCNLVYLTELGRTLQQSLIPLAKMNTNQMSEGLSEKDISHLKVILKKITANLKD